MKRQSILLILVLLQVLFICVGCGSSEKSAEPESPAAVAKEAAAEQRAINAENVEDVVGIFEGLEDNHTAIFSFDGAEEAFYFEDPKVQTVLYEAALGSSYTLSYSYDDHLGYVIYKISE